MALTPLAPGAPIRFLVAEASRTGTPRCVASLLGWLGDHEPDHPLQVIAGTGGPLQAAFARRATVRVLDPGPGPARAETLAKGFEELGWGTSAARVRDVRRQRVQRGLAAPGLVWAHGATSLRWLDAVPRGVPVVAHIHELATGIDRSLAGLDVGRVLRRPDRLIAVSQAVADHLVDDRGIDPRRVRVHHVWVPEANGPASAAAAPPGLAADALVVGGCGTVGWRKGTDLFLLAALAVGPTLGGRPVHWVWVGSGPAVEQARLARDVAAMGLTGRVHLVGEVDDTRGWFDRFDVFALTSREDPFPLVALEAGAAGVPIVAFRSGGIVELLPGPPSPWIADPLDVEGLGRRIAGLLGDGELRRRVGAAVRARVAADLTADVAIPPLWSDVGGPTAATRA